MNLPLKGLLVLEFSQYLSGPSAGLRLADMGARVIKVERPGSGEAGRRLAIKNLWHGDDSLLFHTINRNKESITADMKDPEDMALLHRLIGRSDVLIHNFRPDVMGRHGLDYPSVARLNPGIVYAEISGYGRKGPWKDKPGQDLLLQSMSGLTFTTGERTGPPVPFGISIGDILSGAQLTQGILSLLIRRQRTGRGGQVEVSILESLLDFQFELLTTYFQTKRQPQRSALANGQPLLSAPYGIYRTQDGYLALAMMDIHVLADTIGCTALNVFDARQAFVKRDEIKRVLAAFLAGASNEYWLERLRTAGLWAMPVLDWNQMTTLEAYRSLEMEQHLMTERGEIVTTRCPIRFDGQRIFSSRPAPRLGEQDAQIRVEAAHGIA